MEPGGGGFRNRHHAGGIQTETLDGLLADPVARGNDHGRDSQVEQHRGAAPNPASAMMPFAIHPRREIVECQHAGTAGYVRDGKIGPVDQIGAQTGQLAIQAPDPPAPLRTIARTAAALQIRRSGIRHAKRLVGDQDKLIVGKRARKPPGPSVTPTTIGTPTIVIGHPQ